MNGPGSGCREADAEPAAVLRVAARHERRRLLMADLDEADPSLTRPQRLHDPVDAVAGQAEDDGHAPIDQTIRQHICSRSRHGVLPCGKWLASAGPGPPTADTYFSGETARRGP